jgi:hypothetical protein
MHRARTPMALGVLSAAPAMLANSARTTDYKNGTSA